MRKKIDASFVDDSDENDGHVILNSGFKKFYVYFCVIATTIMLVVVALNSASLFLGQYIPALTSDDDPPLNIELVTKSMAFILLLALIFTVVVLVFFSRRLFPRLKDVWRVNIVLLIIAVVAGAGEFISEWEPNTPVTPYIPQALFTAFVFIVIAGILLLKVKLTDRKYKKMLENYQNHKAAKEVKNGDMDNIQKIGN